MEFQIASNESKITAKVAQLPRIEGRFPISHDRGRQCRLIYASMVQDCMQLRRLAPMLKVLNIQLILNFKSSMHLSHHFGGRLVNYSRIRPFSATCKCQRLVVACGTHNLLHSTREITRSLVEYILDVRAQYDQELTDLRYKCHGSQARLASYDTLSEASHVFLRVTSEFYRSVKIHLCLSTCV